MKRSSPWLVSFGVLVTSAAHAQEWEDAPLESDAEVEETAAGPPAAEKAAPEAALPPAATPEHPAAKRTEPCARHRRWRHGGSLSVSIGKARFESDTLDEQLGEHGYEPISDRALQVGLLGMKTFDSGLLLGFGGSYTRTRASSGPDGRELHASIGHLYGMLGGSAVRTRRWLIAPAVLVGGYHLKLDIDSSESASFGEVLDDPERGVELSQSGWFVGGMIVLDRRIQWRSDRTRFTSIGLRVGVMEAVSRSGWRFGDDDATGGAAVLPRVGFVSLALGFGRY
jgi:hypothetical protein